MTEIRKAIFPLCIAVLTSILFIVFQEFNIFIPISEKTLKADHTAGIVKTKVGKENNSVTVSPWTRTDNLKIRYNETNVKKRRYLFGIFSHDVRIEHERRMVIRSSYLWNHNYTCSLHEILMNPNLTKDSDENCRFVYTFVLAGGGSNRPQVCYWGDDYCGTNISSYHLEKPPPNSSDALLHEWVEYNQDITFLNIHENMNGGKSESWYTHASALVNFHPNSDDFKIDFIGKIDSDTILHIHNFFLWERTFEEFFFLDEQPQQQQSANGTTTTTTYAQLDTPYAVFGTSKYRKDCAGRGSGYICDDPNFHAPLLWYGAFQMITKQLAKHAYLNETSLEQKQAAFMPSGEDLSFSNMIYDKYDNQTWPISLFIRRGMRRVFQHAPKTKDPIYCNKTYWLNALNQ